MKIDGKADYMVYCFFNNWESYSAKFFNYQSTSPYLKATAFKSQLLQELQIEKLRFN